MLWYKGWLETRIRLLMSSLAIPASMKNRGITTAMGISLALAAILFFGALKIAQARDY